MKEKIEELIGLADEELTLATNKVMSSNTLNEEAENEAMYWSIRLQTLMQVLELYKEDYTIETIQ